MTATSQTTDEGAPLEQAAAAPAQVSPGEIAGSLIGGLAADRCGECDEELAPDQRYCVECGTRRGKATLPLATTAVAVESAGPLAASERSGGGTSPRMLVLVGVVTLLLALGVGILIGQSIAPTVHVTVAGGASVSGASNSGTTGSGSKATSGGTKTSSSSYGNDIGTTCSAGTAGCVNGKQSGNLFGGSGG